MRLDGGDDVDDGDALNILDCNLPTTCSSDGHGSHWTSQHRRDAPCLSCTRSPRRSTSRPHSSHLRARQSLPRAFTHHFEKRLTSIAKVGRRLVILPEERTISIAHASSRGCWKLVGLIRWIERTCLAARASFSTPQPWRKQFASSKMASTSSPLASPPLFKPALRARSSTAAALDAA